jgi:acetyltransferase-like isoleucine patch superfamily enzyme
MRTVLRPLRNAWLDLRTLRWLIRLRFELRRNGGRLKVEGWRGVRMAERPRIRVTPQGKGNGVTTIRLAPDVLIGYGLILEIFGRDESLLEVGRGARIYEGVRLELRGGTIRLGERSMVHDHCVLKADGDLQLGTGARVSYGTCLHCAERIEIGSYSGTGEYVGIIDSDHTFDGSDIPYTQKPITSDPILIDSNVMVGRGSVVLKGARLGKNSVVAASSVVVGGEYPAKSLLAGTPAKRLRETSPKS